MKKVFIVVRIDYEKFNNEENCGWEFLSQDDMCRWSLSSKFSMAWHFDSQALAELALENFQPTSQDLLYFTIMPIYTKSRNA